MRRPRSFKAKNQRRQDLIDLDFARGLSDAERAELDRLTRECDEWVDSRSALPRPVIPPSGPASPRP